jgi:hypothetical protein
MLKLWSGKDGGSIIISKSDPQHEMMNELGFKSLVGLKYGSMNRLDPGDYTMYRAADYLGNDSIYRCMRINDDTDTKFIALKKDRHFRSKVRQQNKIILSLNEVVSVSTEDRELLACAACKRIFKLGNFNRYLPSINIEDTPTGAKLAWEYKNMVCCDKHYAIGADPRNDGNWLAFCVSDKVFQWGYKPGEAANDNEKLVVDYLVGRKEAKKVVRDR